MKIPFTLDAWLKDKSQKVETRDGRTIRNIWKTKQSPFTNNKKAEVCALIDGEESALIFFEGGRYIPSPVDIDSPLDLFIITPEPELTNWQTFISGCLQKHGLLDCGAADRIAKECSAELLELARKEIMDGWSRGLRDTQDRSGKAYSDGYILGLEKGKAEALKDLPRWKKADRDWDAGTIDFAVFHKNDGGDHEDWLSVEVTNRLYKGEYYIELSDLEKLPKED